VQRIDLTYECVTFLSVSPDGRWAACTTLGGTEVFALDSLSSSSRPLGALLLTNKDGGQQRFASVAWGPSRPDGSYLAVVVYQDNVRPSIWLYRLTQAHDAADLVARLTFPDLFVDDIAWSPDGKWLVIGSSPDNAGFEERLLSLPPLVPLPHKGSPTPLDVTVTAAMMPSLQPSGNSPVAWGPKANDLTLAGNDFRDIVVHDAVTKRDATVLHQDSGDICALAWALNGQGLVFQLCRGEDAGSPPAQLYFVSPALP
jgi:hypothetical protein